MARSSSRKRHEKLQEIREQQAQTQKTCDCEVPGDVRNSAAPRDSSDGARELPAFEDWGANGDLYGYCSPGAEFQMSPARLVWRVVLVLLLWLWQVPGVHRELQQESFAAMTDGDLDWVNGTSSSDMLVLVKSARAGRALATCGLLIAANTSVAQAAPHGLLLAASASVAQEAPCGGCFLLDFVATRGHVVVPMVSGSWRADAVQQLHALGAPAFFMEAAALGSWRVGSRTHADDIDYKELENAVLRCTAEWLPGGGKKNPAEDNEAKEVQKKRLREQAARALAGLEEYSAMHLGTLQALAVYTPGVSVKWPDDAKQRQKNITL